MARIEEQFDQAWDLEQAFVAQPRPPLAERLRRWTAVGLGAVALGAGFAAAPWVAAVVVVLTVWLLRAGSLAASAVAHRRTVRGVKWYDGLRWVTTSPWHLVRAVTGTTVLVAWSAGLGVAAGLLGYALALDVPSTLVGAGQQPVPLAGLESPRSAGASPGAVAAGLRAAARRRGGARRARRRQRRHVVPVDLGALRPVSPWTPSRGTGHPWHTDLVSTITTIIS
jgi:hypothetical protein